MSAADDRVQMHGSAVAVAGRGCLITGAAGSGKSTLALEIIALGGELVADDRVELRRAGAALTLSAPPTISGMIEARGIGILRVPVRSEVPLAIMVDLDREASARLPASCRRDLLGTACPVIRGRGRAGLASVLVVLLRAGGIPALHADAGA